MSKPRCLKCAHYFSTFDPQKPRGCRLYSMKTASFPSQVVKRESGSECAGYEEKAFKGEKKGLDLSDPKLW